MKPKSQAAPPHPQTDGLSARATVVPANDITAPVNPSRGKPAKAAVNDPVPKVAGYQIDPLALVLPPGTEAELAALVDSIAKIGQIHPAVLLDNKILDGRDRAVACERLGIPLRTVSLGHCEDPVAYVIAANLPRRQLNATQRALVAVKFMPHYATEAAKRKRALSGTRANPDGTQPQVPESLPEPAACGDARDQAAKATGANPRYVSDMLKLQLEAPELFKAVDAGEISIPTALKKLAAQRDNRTAPETGSTRDAFLAVLCDDEASSTTRTAEKFYGAKTSPNIAFFRFLAVGATKILPGSQHGLTQVALFAVPVESSLTIKDKNGRSFCKASCRFLSLSIRGNVPQPATVPGQLVDDGIEGVIKMIEAMFPDARKVLSSAQHEAPHGWQYVPRDKKVGADAALANEQAAAPLADAHIESASQPEPPALTREDQEREIELFAADLTAKNNAVIKGDFAEIRRCDNRIQKWYAQLGQKFPECREVSERITQIHADLSYIAAVASESSKALPDTEREQLIRQISDSHPKRYAELRRQIEAATLDLRALFKS